MKKILSTSLFYLFVFPLLVFCQEEPLKVFDAYRGDRQNWMKYQEADNAWYKRLCQLAEQQLGAREESMKTYTTKAAWEERKKILKERLLKSIGGLPEKTPLKASIVEKLDRPKFTVEKIIYQSLPQFYVTAALFIPKERQQPAPAVIYCSGHTQDGFRSATYQGVILNLVDKGFIVLAFDPIGQGERYQYLDENGLPDIGGPTKEHSYSGIPCLLNGHSVARYMINDGIRAVDYLLSRPEVDPQRIGITGRSGGGTQSAYIAAFDDRIYAAAPENYITNFRRIWESIGPQDAEQNFLSGHVLEIDHGDFLTIRAPKPAMMLTTTRDFFSIQGARETYREVQKVYKLYEAAGQLAFTEDDYRHGSTPANREALYAFFQKSLNLPGDSTDRDLLAFTAEELTITKGGQVVKALHSKTVFDLNREVVQQWPPASDSEQSEAILSKIKDITGISRPSLDPQAVFTGRIQRKDYAIEKYFLEFSDDHYPIPFYWVYRESEKPSPLVLYLNSEGKEAGIRSGGEIERLVRAGYTVMAPDLLNVGELGPSPFQGDSHISDVSFNLILGSSLVGKSLPALQTEDLYFLIDFARKQTNIDPSQIIAIADKNLCVPLLHYGVLERGLAQVVLRKPLVSWRELAQTERYLPAKAYSIVPGALPFYDIPDLIRLLESRKISLIQAENGMGKPLTSKAAARFYGDIKIWHKNKGGQMEIYEAMTFAEIAAGLNK